MSLLVGENLDFHNDHSTGSDKHASGWQKTLSLVKPILVWKTAGERVVIASFRDQNRVYAC